MSNIITVSFANCGRVKYTEPLYQYDYGQILRITDLDLPLSFQAHFCNDGDTQTTTSIGLNNEVAIPDAYLQTGKGVICFIYLHTGNDDGETEYKIIFPVNPRQAITNQEPTPAQQSEIDQYIIALNTGVTSASESAEDSEAWAVGERNGEPVGSGDETYHNNAKYYADLSGDNSDLAEGYASDAHTSEVNAKSSEDNAKDSETNAHDYATQAYNSADSADANAKLSQSYAVGGTNTRQGEDTDNSKYYSEVAQQAANTAGFLDVYIDQYGHLIYLRTDQVDVDFSLINGHLIMEAV